MLSEVVKEGSSVDDLLHFHFPFHRRLQQFSSSSLLSKRNEVWQRVLCRCAFQDENHLCTLVEANVLFFNHNFYENASCQTDHEQLFSLFIRRNDTLILHGVTVTQRPQHLPYFYIHSLLFQAIDVWMLGKSVW